MNESPESEWAELAKLWRSAGVPVSAADIEKLHELQRRRLRAATAVELVGAALGIAATSWLAFASRFLWLGVVTILVLAMSLVVVLRARRMRGVPASSNLKESLKGSLAYQDWLAEQLRYGRGLSFVALFAVTVAASAQLMHVATTPSRLLATAVAGTAIVATLAWNLALAWNVWRRKRRLAGFLKKLLGDQAGELPGP